MGILRIEGFPQCLPSRMQDAVGLAAVQRLFPSSPREEECLLRLELSLRLYLGHFFLGEYSDQNGIPYETAKLFPRPERAYITVCPRGYMFC